MSLRRTASLVGWSLLIAAAAVAAIAAAWVAAPHVGTSGRAFPILVGGLAGVVALIAAAVALEPAWLLSIGLALSMFSGNWSYLHIPGPLDRVVVFTGVIALLVRSAKGLCPRIEVRRVHWLLGVLVLYGFGSMAYSNTLRQHAALFEFLDRLGAVPFLLYLIAPSAFATERQRQILLVVLVAVGAYLGLTAFFEIVGPHALVFPSYIADPAIGIHLNRARGPFLEAGADGLAMFDAAVAAAVLYAKVTAPRIRVLLVFVIALCLLGIVVSLTRQVWVGALVGSLIAGVMSPRLRRYIPVAVVTVGAFVAIALVAIPGLHSKVNSRAASQKPVWDRLNSDAAALRMIETRPLLGFGWGTFPVKSSAYYHVARTYPLSSVPEVHNVVLSNGAELGMLGVALWLSGLVWALILALGRRAPPEIAPWKLALVAVVVAWFVQINFAPVSYAFDNYIPWLFAGIVMAGSTLPAGDLARDGLRRRSVPNALNAASGPSRGRLGPSPPSR